MRMPWILTLALVIAGATTSCGGTEKDLPPEIEKAELKGGGSLSWHLQFIPTEFMDKRTSMIVTVNSNGLLEQNDKVFSSIQPQSTLPPGSEGNCEIPFRDKGAWKAWYTTYYVVSTTGQIYMTNACGKAPIRPGATDAMLLESPANLINHAALANADAVLGAGEVDVRKGKIIYIDNCSGHYRPTKASLEMLIDWLAAQGVQGLDRGQMIGRKMTKVTITDPQTGRATTDNMRIAENIRAGTSDCYSYATIR